MPVGKSLIILIAILLTAVFVAHNSSAASEKDINTTTCHGLIAIPVALLIACGFTTISIMDRHLAVDAWAERISILFAVSSEISVTY